MLYSLPLSFLYQRDKVAALLWITGIIPLEPLYNTFVRQANLLCWDFIDDTTKHNRQKSNTMDKTEHEWTVIGRTLLIFQSIVLHRFWKLFEVCPTFRFSLQRRPPEFAAIVSAKGLMIRNPTKYTIFGAMTDLKQACRNSLWEANSQDISTLYDSLTPSALYAESRNKLFF